MKTDDLVLPYCYLIVVWLANINDLIRGKWFYGSWSAVIFWNFMGVLSIYMIIKSYRNKSLGDSKELSGVKDGKI